MSSSRAPAPPPLKMPTRAMTSPTTSPSSESSVSRSYNSDDYLMYTPSATHHRSSSSGSSSKIKSPKVNAHSYCGRHSDEFLFGPVQHSITDLWRTITKKE